MKNEYFVQILANKDKKYDCETSDYDNKTPFIHACIVNVVPLMMKVFANISLHNANSIDKSGCSAMYYAASNNQDEFCEYLFIHGVDIVGKLDNNGIMRKYQEILKRYEIAKEKAEIRLNKAKEKLQDINDQLGQILKRNEYLNKRIDIVNDEIRSYNNNPDSVYTSDFIDEEKLKIEKQRRDLNSEYDDLHRQLEKAELDVRAFDRNYNLICNATRSKILSNIKYIEYIAEYSVRTNARL